MDIKTAAIETLNHLEDNNNNLPINHPWFGREHVLFMLDQIFIGDVKGEKAHRWLGWAQCAICFADGATLEELEAINKNA